MLTLRVNIARIFNSIPKYELITKTATHESYTCCWFHEINVRNLVDFDLTLKWVFWRVCTELAFRKHQNGFL